MKRSARFIEAIEAYESGDADTALRLMSECAEAGDPNACLALALWYQEERSVPADIKKSRHWLSAVERLAEEGNAEAQWEIGQHLRFGNLFEKNVERANFWLERAAEGEHGEAQHHLAAYLETGQYGYPADPATAAIWYKRALERENPETLYLFAMKSFDHGKPTEEALKLLRRAADKGLGVAQEALRTYTH